MHLLNNEEMIIVKGGGSNNVIWKLVGGIVMFVIGFIDGFISPRKCN